MLICLLHQLLYTKNANAIKCNMCPYFVPVDFSRSMYQKKKMKIKMKVTQKFKTSKFGMITLIYTYKYTF